MRWFVIALVAACSSKSDVRERYAVGTYLYTGSVMFGSSDCKYTAPDGVLDGSMILKPGTITETCPKAGPFTIIAEYTDHIALTFPKTAKLGEEINLSFELRNASDAQLTPTLSEMGHTQLADGCTALKDLERHGAQDTGRSPFMSATAAAPGSCKVSIDIDLPVAGGNKTFHGEQTITVTSK